MNYSFNRQVLKILPTAHQMWFFLVLTNKWEPWGQMHWTLYSNPLLGGSVRKRQDWGGPGGWYVLLSVSRWAREDPRAQSPVPCLSLPLAGIIWHSILFLYYTCNCIFYCLVNLSLAVGRNIMQGGWPGLHTGKTRGQTWPADLLICRSATVMVWVNWDSIEESRF